MDLRSSDRNVICSTGNDLAGKLIKDTLACTPLLNRPLERTWRTFVENIRLFPIGRREETHIELLDLGSETPSPVLPLQDETSLTLRNLTHDSSSTDVGSECCTIGTLTRPSGFSADRRK